MTLFSCENLGISIGGKQICRNMQLGINAGQCWGILGRNGVGKTTMLHTFARLRSPGSGSLKLLDKSFQHWSRRSFAQTLGIVAQDSQDPFSATVLETVLIGRHPYISVWQTESAEDMAMAKAALTAVSLDDLASRDINTLSGGERQRVALATVLVQSPQLFLLDEPTNHLDLHHQVNLLGMLVQHARDKSAAIVMTLHDINLAARFCDHLILLFGDGEVAHGPTDALLSEDNLQRLYGHRIVKIESESGRAFLPG